MRIYSDCRELRSELMREVFEMGTHVHTGSYQNKVTEGDEQFLTKEIINYSYCLKTLKEEDYLFKGPGLSCKAWADAEFLERVDKNPINPGEAWKLRRDVWEQFLDENGRFDYTYNQRLTALLEIIELLKSKPNTRQAILAIWDADLDPMRTGGKKRVPCSVYYQFIIRGGKLSIIYNQRSCDVFTHFGNDVYLAWKLMNYVAMETEKNIGYLYHNIASLHSYKRDWENLKKCIDEF